MQIRMWTRPLAVLLACAALCAAETKVLENITLIDGTGRPAIANASLVITDGKVVYAGAKGSARVPAGAQRFDLSGKYVIPGIINLHGHLGNVVDLTQDPKNFTRENVEKQLRLYASYGVTSVISMGSDQDPVYAVRSEQRAGRPAMTRVFTAGRGFTGKNGYPTTAPGMKGVPYEVGSVEDVNRALDELASKKVDIVKIWVDDHLGREAKIPMDLSKAIIDGARKRGLRVAAHIFYLSDAKGLVDAGLAGLAHSVRDTAADDALITSMKKRGAWLAAPTLTRELSTYVLAERPQWLNDPFFTRGVSENVRKGIDNDAYRNRIKADKDYSKYPGFLDMAKKNLKKMHDSGVNIGFGTDTGPPARFQGFYEHLEMELMAQAGLTPAQILHCATGRAAQFLGQSATLGTLQPGRWADLVVLDRNPLDDIKNTRSINMVMIAGNKL